MQTHSAKQEALAAIQHVPAVRTGEYPARATRRRRRQDPAGRGAVEGCSVLVKWTAHATAQLRHIHDYIAQDSPLYARRVSEALVYGGGRESAPRLYDPVGCHDKKPIVS